MKELTWGRALMRCRVPECSDGRRILEAVRSGRTIRQIGTMLGVSDEMTQYYVRRLVERDQAMCILNTGLKAYENNAAKVSTILTPIQIEAVRMLLSGATEPETGATCGVTQSAVAGRLQYARNRLALVTAPWAVAILAGLRVVGKTRSLTRFQFKPGLSGKRRSEMKEHKPTTERVKELTVELTAGEVNFAVAHWVSTQPEASRELKKLVLEGANVSLKMKADGTGATLKLWTDAGPATTFKLTR